MFRNIYLKRLIGSLRIKDNLIWTLAFPIFLSTLFFFAFSSLDNEAKFKVVKIAIVNNEGYNENTVFKQVAETVSETGEDQLLSLTLVDSKDEADTLLKKGTVAGYIVVEDDPVLYVKNNNLEQTILKGFLDNYLQTQSMVMQMIERDPTIIQTGLINDILSQNNNFTKEISLSKNDPSETYNYYYALLAMMCLYGGFLGTGSIMGLQPNLSALGARKTVSPVKRSKLIFYDLLSQVTLHFVNLLIVITYMSLILGVNFGNKLLYILLICFLGSLTGVTFGAFIGTIGKAKEAVKTAIIITVTMICSYLSGLMVGGINYVIAENTPILSWINPAARISDAFYNLYYYDTYEKFFMNIGILLIISVFFIILTTLSVRRRRYESI